MFNQYIRGVQLIRAELKQENSAAILYIFRSQQVLALTWRLFDVRWQDVSTLDAIFRFYCQTRIFEESLCKPFLGWWTARGHVRILRHCAAVTRPKNGTFNFFFNILVSYSNKNILTSAHIFPCSIMEVSMSLEQNLVPFMKHSFSLLPCCRLTCCVDDMHFPSTSFA
jgi:hypothetical protein